MRNKEVLSASREALDTIDSLLLEVSQTNNAVRVERLLESAAPGMNHVSHMADWEYDLILELTGATYAEHLEAHQKRQCTCEYNVDRGRRDCVDAPTINVGFPLYLEHVSDNVKALRYQREMGINLPIRRGWE